jgi:uncharacterized protein (DUF302 family)
VTDDLEVRAVPGDVTAVVERLTELLDARGIEVFATIDHAAGARGAGLELPDEVLVVFGDPAVGTSLMQADPRCGLDLPLRMLVWSQDGSTRLAYEDPASLLGRYAVDPARDTVDRLRGLLERLSAELAGSP